MKAEVKDGLHKKSVIEMLMSKLLSCRAEMNKLL